MISSAPKTQWSRPELVVLARSTPEESVLDGCKLDGNTSGPYATHQNCKALSGSRCSGPCSSRNRS
ncbi:MAG: hypothetical protein JXA87_10970 [Thermoleophilia bacterium]|nr:hypothetical protein [Thermoleophilia bacterium]